MKRLDKRRDEWKQEKLKHAKREGMNGISCEPDEKGKGLPGLAYGEVKTKCDACLDDFDG